MRHPTVENHEPDQPAAPPLPTSDAGKDIRRQALGFVTAIALAGLAVFALFGLIFVPFVPRRGRIVAALLSLGIGVTQAAYAVPLYFWARRRGVIPFADGFRSGAFMVTFGERAPDRPGGAVPWFRGLGSARDAADDDLKKCGR